MAQKSKRNHFLAAMALCQFAVPFVYAADVDIPVGPAPSSSQEVEISPSAPSQATPQANIRPAAPDSLATEKELVPTTVPTPPGSPNLLSAGQAKPAAMEQVPTGESISLPAVPRSILTKNVPKPISDAAVKRSSGARSAASDYSMVQDGSVIFVQFGINQIVPVAIGHLNRIVTPFSEPVATTASTATVETHDNVLYVATDSETPVTLFIREKGNEGSAINLTLVPKRIPPREISVKFPDSYVAATGGVGSKKAEKWETSRPYVETIKDLFKAIALGNLPSGYHISRTPSGLQKPQCSLPGLSFNFSDGQYLAGNNISVFVGVASNISGQAIEFREASCGGWDVAAVAAWPRNVLNSGEKTEIYVAVRKRERQEPTNRRPSLIGSN